MNAKTIKSIKITIEIQTYSVQSCNMLYDSLSIEAGYNPNERAEATLKKEENSLILQIEAKDSVSARASINSFLKWINLSNQIMTLTTDIEK